ncbi:Putative uncharacterized protein [Moritella viscosa]|uniref:Uncharacterized protein n=1 Tax=Moritella viscosa TaxID=80854 RepID=A0ABY1H7P4_9GAMM|nr:Putative uncharacterized protein [Moritella viscosa]SGY84727.1 Putative uncharacterized protein [Moritella viscosa]SGY85743.1 Putative uncharacterized protein [Moritella viscosa]SHN98177.1 Putative uncharacterized protein [Moritella viscosa]SHN99804.1 Putative uncharacterized protein [Moritella viscosa]
MWSETTKFILNLIWFSFFDIAIGIEIINRFIKYYYDLLLSVHYHHDY